MSETERAVRDAIERAKAEGFETDGAVPPGDPWARAYALDMELLLLMVEVLGEERDALASRAEAAVTWWHSIPSHFEAKEPVWVEQARKVIAGARSPTPKNPRAHPGGTT